MSGSDNASLRLDLGLAYTHALGELAPYFEGLVSGIARATHCRACGRTWCPPRLTCACGASGAEWRVLSGHGVLVHATSGTVRLPLTAASPRLHHFGLVRLDGATNLMFARLAGAEAPRPGDRVRLARADASWSHPAQSVEFLPE